MTIDHFLNYLFPLPSPNEIKNWDKLAGEFGLQEFVLMENAGRSAVEVLLRHLPRLKDQNILIFMGSGNNGGDGACVARNLMDAGARCHIFSYKRENDFNGSSAKHLELALKNGAVFHTIPDTAKSSLYLLELIEAQVGEKPDIIVDGLLGTGFSGILNSRMENLIRGINFLSQNLSNCFVLALDIPSGLNPDSGQPSPIAIRANATASFAAAKPGEIFQHARQWVGQLHVCNIGMPQRILEDSPARKWLLDGHALQCFSSFMPNSYKNCYGHVFVLGGIEGYSGAAHMVSMAALKTGAGLVTAVAPSLAAERIKAATPEIMIYRLGGADSEEWPDSVDENLQSVLEKADSLVIGPGFGRGAKSEKFLLSLLQLSLKCPIVFDADALMIFAKHRDWLAHISEKDILTPHPGEAAALLGGSDVQTNRPSALRDLCQLTKAVVALKGANTLIGQDSMPTFVCPYDICQLAIGGAGDVLAGCIGSLLGMRRYKTWPAIQITAMGVILHALAGLLGAADYPQRGLLASSLINYLPFVKEKYNAPPAKNFVGKVLPWPTLN